MHIGDCIHFNGIQHDRCRADVCYKELRQQHDVDQQRLPCLTGFYASCGAAAPDFDCPRYQGATAEDVAKDRQEMLKALADIDAEMCPQCSAKLQVHQVGGSKAMICGTHGVVANFCGIKEEEL